MIGVDPLIEKLNNIIAAGGLSNLQVTQLSAVIETLEKKNVSKVDRTVDLPDAALNKGRFFWIESENRYVLSDGITWDINHIYKENTLFPLLSWGFNGNGRLGDNTTTSRRSPVSVVGGFTDWIQVSAGFSHSLGVRANGSAWAWGLNSNGRLGDNSITSRLSPVSVVGGFTDWIQVSAGGLHSLGLRANGTAWAWGYNTDGQLGDNTATSKSSPVSVVGGFTDWVQVSAGYNHSLGVRANGTAWAWGFNAQGRLGDGTETSRLSPVSVVGGFSDWIQVSAGGYQSLGLRANGTTWAWGRNAFGQLGIGTVPSVFPNIVAYASPLSVVGGFTDWVQVSAGLAHSLGVRANGSAWAWGYNTGGQLGDNTTANKSSPVSIVGGFTDWIQVSGGGSHSLGVRSNGTAWAWGFNGQGQLGDNTTTSRSSPVSVVGGFTDWIQVSAGLFHSLGVKS
jgi:alpha-tubulin suppressor-like RCC1 family protein